MSSRLMNGSTRNRWLAIHFAATIFVSAFLLFQVQPMISKRLLPWFGGTPAVWTTCMLFFQTLLLGGYAYAHATQQWLRPRQQAVVHLVILIASAVVLRVLPDESWAPEDSYRPVGQILLLLVGTIGLPYFVLSTTGPLVQAWFARSFPGRVPYRLYALSNVGSLLALLSYPFWFERVFDLRQQARLWTLGFAAFVLLCGYAAARLWRTENAETETGNTEKALDGKRGGAAPAAVRSDRPGVVDCLLWLWLPAFASVTLLATTNYVCTDVPSNPFLWVVPLSLYLVTFIIAFDHPRWYLPVAAAVFTLAAIYCVGVVRDRGVRKFEVYKCGYLGKSMKSVHETLLKLRDGPLAEAPPSPTITVNFRDFLVVNFAAMFGICMLCHGELFRRRPHPRHLTLYYLMIAAGGAAGGAAVALIAPHVLSTYFEWEISIFLGFLLAIGLILRAMVNFIFQESELSLRWRWGLAFPGLAFIAVASVGIVDMVQYVGRTDEDVLLRVRNFFGSLSVRQRVNSEGEPLTISLRHGAIIHGLQITDPRRSQQATTYYATVTGVGRTIDHYRRTTAEGGIRIGAVGLGTGTLAAYAGARDAIAFYEINPAVIEISGGGGWFTFVEGCRIRGAQCAIKLGDARLTLAREAREGNPQRFDVLVLDAFSGDAIPAHLLTEEAFEIYRPHLATPEAGGRHGAIAVHISNRYVDLDPIVRGAAERFDMKWVRIVNATDNSEAVLSSTWIILSYDEALMASLQQFADPPPGEPRQPILWTDDRSNVFEVLK